MIEVYYRLAKPGIIYGNLLSTVAGFLLASRGSVNVLLFLATIFGIGLVMASGCVFNNYLDRGIDERMERTKNRVSVTGQIPLGPGLIYGVGLGILGFALLTFTNQLTTLIALAGFVLYVVVYAIFKRLTSLGTIVGSLAGAVPPVVGYCAVSNRFDLGAQILFLILVFWQMPHFYSIAIFRSREYANANIRVLPLTAGIRFTKIAMVAFIIAFTAATLSLTIYHYTGVLYAVIVGLASLWWLFYAIAGWNLADSDKWAKKMFRNSLVVLLILCVTISLGAVLP